MPAQERSILRKRLQQLTEIQVVEQHQAKLAEISSEYPNTIAILESPYPIERYTCGVHAFGFTERPEYVEIAKYGFNNRIVGSDFVEWLLDNDLLIELNLSAAREGDLVFYFDDHVHWKHAGLWHLNDRVQSKWGTGHLYEHAVFEVPESYGTKARFYKSLDFEFALECFRCFCGVK